MAPFPVNYSIEARGDFLRSHAIRTIDAKAPIACCGTNGWDKVRPSRYREVLPHVVLGTKFRIPRRGQKRPGSKPSWKPRGEDRAPPAPLSCIVSSRRPRGSATSPTRWSLRSPRNERRPDVKAMSGSTRSLWRAYSVPGQAGARLTLPNVRHHRDEFAGGRSPGLGYGSELDTLQWTRP